MPLALSTSVGRTFISRSSPAVELWAPGSTTRAWTGMLVKATRLLPQRCRITWTVIEGAGYKNLALLMWVIRQEQEQNTGNPLKLLLA